jgi:hypothetical protein
MHLNAFIVLFIKVENGKVDGERLCITGRSAGGYTTSASLAFRGTFKAGASLDGVSFSFLEFLYYFCITIHIHLKFFSRQLTIHLSALLLSSVSCLLLLHLCAHFPG